VALFAAAGASARAEEGPVVAVSMDALTDAGPPLEPEASVVAAPPPDRTFWVLYAQAEDATAEGLSAPAVVAVGGDDPEEPAAEEEPGVLDQPPPESSGGVDAGPTPAAAPQGGEPGGAFSSSTPVASTPGAGATSATSGDQDALWQAAMTSAPAGDADPGSPEALEPLPGDGIAGSGGTTAGGDSLPVSGGEGDDGGGALSGARGGVVSPDY
jgi:hypothetical protein